MACAACAALGTENWPGIAGGGVRHNASQTPIDPAAAKVLWHRTFNALTFGDQTAPANEIEPPRRLWLP